MNRFDVTIVICTFNRADLLRVALQSLCALETDGQFQYEVLVVDNGSTDATPHVIEEFRKHSSVSIRGVREDRPGVAAARNRGVAETHTPWIAFIDDDEQAPPRWMFDLVDVARTTGADCVGGPLIPLLPPNCPLELVPALKVLLIQGEDYGETRRCTGKMSVGTGNILMKLDVFRRVGGFDESLREAGEDTDLYRRIRASGLVSWHVPQAGVLHHIEPCRAEIPTIRWSAHRSGFSFARRDFRRAGRLGLIGLLGLRLALTIGARLPLYLWARLRGDVCRQLILCGRIWLTEGYVRGALFQIAPTIFPQARYRAYIDFRAERDAVGLNRADAAESDPQSAQCGLSDAEHASKGVPVP